MTLRHALALLVLAVATGAGRPNDDGAPGKDLFGDPLPTGARARLGTVRFRADVTPAGFALSQGGKTLAVGSGCRVLLLDADGALRGRLGPFEHPPEGLAFSPDGKALAVVAYGTALHLFEVATG